MNRQESPPGAVYLAIDLGAGSGRVMAVSHAGGSIRIEPVHRFDSPAVERAESLFWDLPAIWKEIKLGLRKAAETYRDRIRSVGVDSWGVDYAWFDRQGELAGLPHCYRDTRTQAVFQEVSRSLGRAFIFERTGIQFMRINSLYQLCADGRRNPEMFGRLRCFLMIADAVNYWLTGRMACERTNASSTQLYDPRTRRWSRELADGIGLPGSVLPALVDPGSRLGTLRPAVAAETGLTELPVIAVGSHDTASAVAGLPVRSDSFAYLSCGTWALLGAEIGQPLITDAALENNFTNETGVAGTTRFLKNITGLWIIQECRRVWQETDDATIDYDALAALTASAPAFTAFIDPDDDRFASRGNHPDSIRQYCRQSGQTVPESRGEVLRVASESLALKVALTLERLEMLLGRTLEVVHVIGGGVHHSLLMQGIANATGRPVIAGPAEATALGNALVQMMAADVVSSLQSGRALLAESIETTLYKPTESWDNARQRFRSLLNQRSSPCTGC